ncbi:MAG: hypothetical protein CM15mP73_0340 [Hyphomicrobiales bacterium]|nr:MAG: hypothetical protein CM15mP73_0340 [Hyphomicrobiales bacterium]
MVYLVVTDEGTKTVIPSEANAKLTCRLVGNQDPEKILENIHKYIKAVYLMACR